MGIEGINNLIAGAKKFSNEANSTTKAIDSLVDQFETTYTEALESAKAKATEQGCGVMTVGQDEIYVCEFVPLGKVYQAGNKQAYAQWLEKARAQA